MDEELIKATKARRSTSKHVKVRRENRLSTPQSLQPVPHLAHHGLCVLFLVLLLRRCRLGLLRLLADRRSGRQLLLGHAVLEHLAQNLIHLAVGLRILAEHVHVFGQVLAHHLFDDASFRQLDAQLLHGTRQLGQADQRVDVLHYADAGADRPLNLAHGEGLVDLHLDRVELGLGGDEAGRGLAGAYEFTGKVAGFFLGLLGSRGVALGALVGLDDEVPGLGLNLLDLSDVAVELANVGADEGVAFPKLECRREGKSAVDAWLLVASREKNGGASLDVCGCLFKPRDKRAGWVESGAVIPAPGDQALRTLT